MSKAELEARLEELGALQRGHFILSSGRRSDVYFEKFRILEQPDLLRECVELFLSELDTRRVETVCGPATGGMIVAYEAARQLGVKALYAESENGQKALRRGGSVREGERLLVVDDVLTTGLSLRETLDLVRDHGADVVGSACLVDRSSGDLDFGCAFSTAYRVDAETWDADSLPAHLQDVEPIKPGTRRTA